MTKWNLLSHLCGSPEDTQSNAIVMSSLWSAQNPEIGMFISAYIQEKSVCYSEGQLEKLDTDTEMEYCPEYTDCFSA